MSATEEAFARRGWRLLPDGNAWAMAQLEREVAPAHPLYGQKVEPVARALGGDDVAFCLADGRIASVHLCFRSVPDPEGVWPWTVFYPDLDALLADLELREDQPGSSQGLLSPALRGRFSSLRCMVEVIYLKPGEEPREHAEDEGWLHIDVTPDGYVFGSGTGWLPGGERVNYFSRPEDDVSLERALKAALEWAERRGVPRIYVHGLASY